MGRHGYIDDGDYDELSLGRWRGQVASATRGKRGQAFFRALVAALDAMPVKRLVAEELETRDGEVCALGCLGKAQGKPMVGVDTADHDKLAELFDIAPQLAQETMYINDEWPRYKASPEERWRIVRDWAAKQITPGTDAKGGADG